MNLPALLLAAVLLTFGSTALTHHHTEPEATPAPAAEAAAPPSPPASPQAVPPTAMSIAEASPVAPTPLAAPAVPSAPATSSAPADTSDAVLPVWVVALIGGALLVLGLSAALRRRRGPSSPVSA